MIRVPLDKNIVEEAAERQVRKGQYNRALQELQRLVDSQVADGRVFHKIADIYLKKRDSRNAATFLFRAAEAYSSSGFLNKAVTLRNQGLKLDPSLAGVRLNAPDPQQQGR
jgi:hypothetical protein